jgi:hypothetical protein
VIYRLMPHGQTVLPVVEGVWAWGETHVVRTERQVVTICANVIVPSAERCARWFCPYLAQHVAPLVAAADAEGTAGSMSWLRSPVAARHATRCCCSLSSVRSAGAGGGATLAARRLARPSSQFGRTELGERLDRLDQQRPRLHRPVLPAQPPSAREPG